MKEKSISIMAKHRKLVILISVIAIAILGSMITNFFDNRPIKFEDFETAQDLKIFLEQKYPLGSDGDIVFKDLVLSGAKCKLVSKHSDLPNGFEQYDFIGWCKYLTGWVSLDPLKVYQVIVMGNANHEILKYSIGKYHVAD